MIVLISIAVILIAIYIYCWKKFSVLKDAGVKHFQPIPLMGNSTRTMFRIEHITDDVEKLYFSFPEEKFVGKFEFMETVLMIRDLELVKNIAVKDFEYFLNHRNIIDEESDPLFGRNLFSLKGKEWKDMRSTLSPVFTSSKIRLMVPFMVDVGDQMMRALTKNIEASGVGYIDVDIKDMTTRYANDVIASCAFGLKVDSHLDLENQFYVTGKGTATFGFLQVLVVLGFATIPKVMKALKFTMFSEKSKSFFKNLVLSTMQDREERNIIRPDLIHLLMEAKKGKLSHEDKSTKNLDAGFATVEESSVGKEIINRAWSDDDLVAQAILFFIAGFDTVATTMSFLLHELAANPEVQDQLVEEIRQNEAKNGGKFDYNSVQNMTYMDMVVSETLRLWPAVVMLDRVCLKDYNLGKPNNNATKDFIIRQGTRIGIPAWAFHRDAKFYPEPLKFDPERFSEENKHNIKPLTYMPFGLGPRNCIGSRFALCEVKVMAYQLLKHMEVSPCEKTCIPAKLDKESFQPKLQGGHWLRLKPRV